jgi:L-fuculose-phosphate aldolase
MSLAQLKRELAYYSRRILDQHLATGAGGNFSAREGSRILTSPSRFSLEDVTPEQYIEVDIQTGRVASRVLLPSSEVLMHLACCRRQRDAKGVVHTHRPFTVALTSSGHKLKPMFADFVIYLGQDVPNVDYITVTTPQLAAAVELEIGKANSKLSYPPQPRSGHLGREPKACILARLLRGGIGLHPTPGYPGAVPQLPDSQRKNPTRVRC